VLGKICDDKINKILRVYVIRKGLINFLNKSRKLPCMYKKLRFQLLKEKNILMDKEDPKK
jgi:hypothetical protein